MDAFIDPAQKNKKDFTLLGKLGVGPVAVLVVVLKSKNDVQLAGDRHQRSDAIGGPFQPLLG